MSHPTSMTEDVQPSARDEQARASKGQGVPHKEIVAALGVTRATVSGLMAALERDGLVRSAVDEKDRRNLLASLTSRGAFGTLSSDELATLTTLLQRVREGFAVSADATEGHDKDRDDTGCGHGNEEAGLWSDRPRSKRTPP